MDVKGVTNCLDQLATWLKPAKLRMPLDKLMDKCQELAPCTGGHHLLNHVYIVCVCLCVNKRMHHH